MRRFHLLLPIVTLATLAAAGCDGGIGTGGTVAMEVKPLSLTFDATSVGGHSSMTVTVKSIGEKTLTVTGIVLDVAEGDAEQLYLIEPPATPFDLEEGHAQAIELEFAPIAGAEPPRGTLTITSNDESNPTAVVQIDTPERTGKMKLIPDNLEWGNVQMHQGDPPGCAAPPSMVKEFEVTNIGQALLQVTGWDLSPEGELEHFTICPADYASGLPVGASREWKVVFHPFDTDRHVASLFVQHTLGQKEVKLRGGGEGGKCIDLVPEVLAWPNLPQDECGEQNLVIANCGTMPLAIREFKFEPRHLDDFYDLSGDTFDRERYNLRGTIPRASQDDAGEATVHVKYCAEPEIPMTGSC